MKVVGIVLAMIVFAQSAFGQSELVIPWNNNPSSLCEVSHIVDQEGNTYVLASLNAYHDEPLHHNAVIGFTLIKIDKNDKLVWEKFFKPLKSADKCPIIRTSALQMDFIICDKSIVVFYYTNRYARMTIDKVTGDIVSNAFVSENISCNVFNMANLYSNRACDFTLVFYSNNEKNDTLYSYSGNYASKLPNYKQYPKLSKIVSHGIIWDRYKQQYLAIDNKVLHVLDKNFKELKSIILPEASVNDVSVAPYFIACNKSFYVVNYLSNQLHNPTQCLTTVFLKTGRPVSCKKSDYFSGGIMITDDDNIFGLSSISLSKLSDSVLDPVTLIQMDTSQNIKRQINLGAPYVSAKKVSLTHAGEIIVTGTSFSSRSHTDRKPDGIYYYRQNINNIPLKGH